MVKKGVVIFVLMVIILAIVAYFMFKSSGVYTDNPKDWLESKSNKTYVIDVAQATAGRSYYDGVNQIYKDSTIMTGFGYAGWYDENYFTDVYEENGVTKIRFGPELKANDGIPDIFIVERFKEGLPYAFVFVDEDWKNSLPDTNIIWGKEFQNIEKFNFSSVEPGIYVDSVQDELSRFIIIEQGPAQMVGGVIVGNIDLETWNSGNFSGKVVIKQI